MNNYNFLFYILATEMRWIVEDNQMRIVEDQVEKDQEIQGDVRSMHEITNSTCLVLQFIGDCPGTNSDKKLPILGINCWVENKQVLYEQTNCIQSTDNAEECNVGMNKESSNYTNGNPGNRKYHLRTNMVQESITVL